MSLKKHVSVAKTFVCLLVFTTFCASAADYVSAAETGVQTLFDASKTPIEAVITQDVTLDKKADSLVVTTGTDNRWPGIQLNGPWNCADYGTLLLELENPTDEVVDLSCRVDQPGGDGGTGNGTYTESVTLQTGEKKVWKIKLPTPVPDSLSDKFFAMRGNPFSMQNTSGKPFDRSTITELRLYVAEPKKTHKFVLDKITAEPDTREKPKADAESFFPMIDKLGQFIHRDWPGKVKDETDMKSRGRIELADIEICPGPKQWNKYGGWTQGPQLQATGHFRPEKVDGKWWLVDPEGRLFWSHGVDCVGAWSGVTPTTDREFYFAELPGTDSEFAQFWGTANWAPHNYYEGKGEYKTYNFTGANLLRKYGKDWKKIHANIAHQRLRSWGMNTIANWSDAEIYGMKKTPYTATVNATCPTIKGSEGYWGKFADPFHPDFRANYARAFEHQRNSTADDSWCIGYFVDNEISWGDERSLSLAALTSPADQPVKVAFCEWLRKKYDDSIEKLNAVWETKYADWDAILTSTEKPDVSKAKPDLEAFYSVIADQYFKVLSEELKKVAPHKLYLGCRFAWGNDRAVKAAADYCDVVSFNIYKYDLNSLKLPSGVDKPCIIGEFHFGALDRGMFHTGLCPTDSQEDRAAAYEKYVLSGVTNSHIVGTHWFQYSDQATTGRGDGENYQIGLLDICDSPYPETIKAVQNIGYELYKTRFEYKKQK